MYVSVVDEAILRTFAAKEWLAGRAGGISGSRSTGLEGESDFGSEDGGGAVLFVVELVDRREGKDEKRHNAEERYVEEDGWDRFSR